MSSTSPSPRQGPYADAVASNVRAEAGRRRVSQAALSRMTGISGANLSRRWLGQYPFDVEELAKIAKALNVSIGDLVVPAPGNDSRSVTGENLVGSLAA